jgi:hypothetical protein
VQEIEWWINDERGTSRKVQASNIKHKINRKIVIIDPKSRGITLSFLQNHQQNGPFISYFDDGSKIEGIYKNGLRDPKMFRTYSDGSSKTYEFTGRATYQII